MFISLFLFISITLCTDNLELVVQIRTYTKDVTFLHLKWKKNKPPNTLSLKTAEVRIRLALFYMRKIQREKLRYAFLLDVGLACCP